MSQRQGRCHHAGDVPEVQSLNLELFLDQPQRPANGRIKRLSQPVGLPGAAGQPITDLRVSDLCLKLAADVTQTKIQVERVT